MFMMFSVICLILRRMLGNTYDQQLQHECHLMTLGIHTLTISWHEYAQQCYKLDTYVTQRSTS